MTTKSGDPAIVTTLETALAHRPNTLARITRRALLILVDDSASISEAENEQAIRDGVNTVLNDAAALPYADSFCVTIQYLNAVIPICDDVPLAQAPRLTAENYQALGTTPLHDRVYDLFKSAERRLARHADTMVLALAVTDGSDQFSRLHSAADAHRVADRLWASERSLLIGMGVWDGRTDFVQVFLSMGFLRQLIVAPKGMPGEVHTGFTQTSSTFSQASQSFHSMRHTTQTGFGSKT